MSLEGVKVLEAGENAIFIEVDGVQYVGDYCSAAGGVYSISYWDAVNEEASEIVDLSDAVNAADAFIGLGYYVGD